MNEEELKAKAEELTTKEAELKAKEAELKAKEEDLKGLMAKVTKEYEALLAKQKDGYERRLTEREAVIKQLLNGNEPNNTTSTEIQKLIDRRRAQRRG